MASVQDELMSAQSLNKGYALIYHHSFCYIKSMALRCAIDLGIPSAIHRRGGAATLADLAVEAKIHPAKLPLLRRIMRALTVSGIFAASHPSAPGQGQQGSSGEAVYALTPASRLLVGDSATSDMSGLPRFIVHPTTVTPYFGLEGWLRDDGGGRQEEEAAAAAAAATSLFERAHGVTRWEMTRKDAAFSKSLNDAMLMDSSFVMDVVLREGGDVVFRGLTSLVDVGGGSGGAALAIARAFPHVKCTVMDLPQAISQAPDDGTVKFVAGNALESIPPADAIFLKYVLDCFDDNDCIKILKNCKEAIPTRDAGGKVIIINVVIGSGSMDNSMIKETQVLFDMHLMSIGGIERDESEWKRIFTEAGFSDYKIIPILGFPSIIEVYP